MPYGALHVVTISCHMKYSMWPLFLAIWSTPYGHFLMPYGVLHVVTISCQMEYSMWSLFLAIWSTPCGHYFLPYGVLHVVTISYHMEYSMWSLFFAIWSTPCGHSGVHILTCLTSYLASFLLISSPVYSSPNREYYYEYAHIC